MSELDSLKNKTREFIAMLEKKHGEFAQMPSSSEEEKGYINDFCLELRDTINEFTELVNLDDNIIY